VEVLKLKHKSTTKLEGFEATGSTHILNKHGTESRMEVSVGATETNILEDMTGKPGGCKEEARNKGAWKN